MHHEEVTMSYQLPLHTAVYQFEY